MSATVQLLGRVVRTAQPAGCWRQPDLVSLAIAVDGLVVGVQAPVEWVQLVADATSEVLDLQIGDVIEASGRLNISRWARVDGVRRQALQAFDADIHLVRRWARDESRGQVREPQGGAV